MIAYRFCRPWMLTLGGDCKAQSEEAVWVVEFYPTNHDGGYPDTLKDGWIPEELEIRGVRFNRARTCQFLKVGKKETMFEAYGTE